nr:hypothetical protein BaRGS_010720 [Batillaria attramentaria]
MSQYIGTFVTIEPTDSATFRGFFIQARNASSPDQNRRFGNFEEGSGSRTECNSGAATHAYASDRTSITLSWRAPPVPQGDFVFKWTRGGDDTTGKADKLHAEVVLYVLLASLWKRKRGRLRNSWRRDTEAELCKQATNWTGVAKVAQNRV